MGLMDIINNAGGGLRVNREQAKLVSENVANADTDGYARRSAKVSNVDQNRVGAVVFEGVQRTVDVALAREARAEGAGAQTLETRADAMQAVSRKLGEPQDGDSLGARLSKLEGTLTSLADNPSESSAQSEAVRAAKGIAKGARDVSAEIQRQREAADRQIGQAVDQVNKALERVEALNEKIEVAGTAGKSTAALEDQRGRAIDTVAENMPVTVMPQENGTVSIYTESGATLLDGKARTVEFSRTSNIPADKIYANGAPPAGYSGGLSGLSIDGVDVTPTGTAPQKVDAGRIAGLFQTRDADMTEAQQRVDKVAEDVIRTFQDPAVDPTVDTNADNAPDVAGLFEDPNAGGPYADAAGDEVGIASRIRLNPAADPLAGGDASAFKDGVNAATALAPGDGTQARAFADALTDGTRSTDVNGNTATLVEAGNSFVAAHHGDRGGIENDAEAARVRADAASDARENARGVDIDAELQKLMQLEKSYSANSQVITTVNRMFDALLSAAR